MIRPIFVRQTLVLGTVLLTSCTGISDASSSKTEDAAAIAESAQATPATKPRSHLEAVNFQTYDLPTASVYVVSVPPSHESPIQVAVTNALIPLPELAQAEGAIAAINAGFFDPENGLTTSYVTVNGELVANPEQNDRLLQNPDLQDFLPAILNRSEFRIYDCGTGVRYDITLHSAPLPSGCTLASAVGAGPQLLPTPTGYEEGFLANNSAGELIRDALGSQSPNARSAIGLKPDGTVILAIARQQPQSNRPTGLSLAEMSDFLVSLGVQQALNLDGGSSTGLYFDGQTYFGRLDEAGQPVERPIKSILLVR